MGTYTQRRPDNGHVHLRDLNLETGELLRFMVPYTARQFGRAVCMGNTKPPTETAASAAGYKEQILGFAKEAGCLNFEPVVTLFLTERTTPLHILEAHAAGIVVAKHIPDGVSTNSDNGLADLLTKKNVLATMRDVGMILSVHPEKPGVFCLDREEAYLPTIAETIRLFPRLRIVVEHLTTKAGVEFVVEAPENVAGTITAHHLCMTLDDLISGGCQPHNVCAPCAKRPSDREALWSAIGSGNPKFFFVSDSAPHMRELKECAKGKLGTFTEPFVMPLLVQKFEKRGLLHRLEAFTSEFWARFYGFSLNEDTITLKREPWQIPASYHGVVPFMAGEMLGWQLA
ncbi:MAG: dihydroorotase [Candidatus Andersenbacteria bacterium]|nr:dihydroorotase [bacterium]MDZ4225575.1 dihydroorotase [Candidatus Andersenbacteria bacterium]